MLDQPVPLQRRFSLVPKTEEDADTQELLSAMGEARDMSWSVIEAGHRSVILAEAGAGKTFEMLERARHWERQDKYAFFIRIEEIEGGFEEMFEVGDAERLESWLASSDEAWFFLDSVDEARLKDAGQFRKAIRRFGQRIKNAIHRAHIVISGRPYSWQMRSDRSLIEEYLPFAPRETDRDDSSDWLMEGDDDADQPQSQSALKIYRLDSLSSEDIQLFANCRGTPDVDRLIDELKRTNLMEIASRPFDLELVLSKWTSDGQLGSRLDLLRHTIDQRLDEINPDRERRQPINLEMARMGARRLAAAVVLTGQGGISIPDAAQTTVGIDAKAVLAEWNPNDVLALLERGLFNDVLYGMVRFRHRSVRELLAAEWLSELLRDGHARHEIEALLLRKSYGQWVIVPRLRPVLSWLILLDGEILEKALAIDPEIAVEDGDPSQLPFEVRQMLLNNIVENIVAAKAGRRSGDNQAIARIAQEDLAEETARLIAAHKSNDDVIFYLGRLAWQGRMVECVPDLRDIAIDQKRDVHARVAATRAVLTCCGQDDRISLWQELNDLKAPLMHLVLAELLNAADADQGAVLLLTASIEKLSVPDWQEKAILEKSLHRFIDRLPMGSQDGTPGPLALLISGLNAFLDREPHITRRECRVSEMFSWLLAPATHAVERLVDAKSELAMHQDAMAVMIKMPAVRYQGGVDLDDYKERLGDLVPAWPQLNDALFWHCIEQVRAGAEEAGEGAITDDWQVQLMGHYWRFDCNSFMRVVGCIRTRNTEDDKLVALTLAYRLYRQCGSPAEWLTVLEDASREAPALEKQLKELVDPELNEAEEKRRSEQAEYQRAQEREKQQSVEQREQWIADLKADPERVRNPPGLPVGQASRDQLGLFHEIGEKRKRNHWGDGANWQALIPEFGEEVAKAYRDAAVQLWRNVNPTLRTDGSDYSNSMAFPVIFALVGLEIEARENEDFPINLSDEELHHALRFIPRELNGFPSWLEKSFTLKPVIVLDFVLTQLFWELANTDPDQPMHYILQDLVYSAPWMHNALAEPVLKWVSSNTLPNNYVVGHCLRIMISGGVGRADLAQLAADKITKRDNPTLDPMWFALWVDADPETGIPAVETWLQSQDAAAAGLLAQLFITALAGDRYGSNSRPNLGEFYKARHLKRLLLLMHQFIRTEDDIDRVGQGAFSPVLRDEAQEARNALLTMLVSTPGKEAYLALVELALDYPNPERRHRIRQLAHERAELDADLEPWSADQVCEFEREQTITPKTHQQLFDLAVSRLTTLKHWLEQSNNSPYRTWQRADDETEMRILIAGQLNSQSRVQFSIAQESELPNKQRPDIWVQADAVTSPVPIELKLLDQGWTGPKLCERLRNQLAGDYLRESTARCGVMLLVWQGVSAKRGWKIGDRIVKLGDLEEALEEYWESISGAFPGVTSIDVIVIDLTIREAKSDT